MSDTRTLDELREKWAGEICPEAQVYHIWEDVYTEHSAYAMANPHPEINAICIRVTPVDVEMPFPAKFGIARDLEVEYVHELLHFLFANIEPKEKVAYREWESVIDRLSRLIIKLDRKNEHLY